jgi:hypothetical protein
VRHFALYSIEPFRYGNPHASGPPVAIYNGIQSNLLGMETNKEAAKSCLFIIYYVVRCFELKMPHQINVASSWLEKIMNIFIPQGQTPGATIIPPVPGCKPQNDNYLLFNNEFNKILFIFLFNRLYR